MRNIFKQSAWYLSSRKYILIFSCIYFLIRLIRLDSYFFLRDERDLLLTALSLAQTGKDLFGHSYPLIFLRISPQAPLLGMYWVIPIISIFRITSPFMVKVLYLLPTIFFPLLVFELVLSITKEWRLSIVTAIVVSLSPWYFHIGRLAIEAHLAYFFCLLGLIFYIKNKKGIALLPLLLSYFSYFGIRPFLLAVVPYVELSIFFLIPSTKKNWQKMFLSCGVFIFLFACVFILSSRIEKTAARASNEIIILNNEKLTLETNFLREISDAPFFMREFFDNKPTIVVHTLFSNFFKGLDFSYLFSSGDYVGIYNNGVMGQFFPFLFIFLIFGLIYIAKKKKSGYIFVAGLSLIGLTSSLINSYSLTFSIRSSFSLIGIGFICALGIVYIYELSKNKWKYFFIVSLLSLYICFSSIFFYKYLFQNYKTINSSFNEQERFAAQFSKKNKVQKIIVTNIHSYFLSYLSTLPSISASLLQSVQVELNKVDGYQLDNRYFSQCTAEQNALASIDQLPHSTLFEESCLSTKTKLFISQYKPKNIVELPNPEYNSDDINREVKFYFLK